MTRLDLTKGELEYLEKALAHYDATQTDNAYINSDPSWHSLNEKVDDAVEHNDEEE